MDALAGDGERVRDDCASVSLDDEVVSIELTLAAADADFLACSRAFS